MNLKNWHYKLHFQSVTINLLKPYNIITSVICNFSLSPIIVLYSQITGTLNTYTYKPDVFFLCLQNYNKSRIHSYRGAKDVIVTLDKTEIFKGEIERACGGTEGGTEAFGDVSVYSKLY